MDDQGENAASSQAAVDDSEKYLSEVSTLELARPYAPPRRKATADMEPAPDESRASGSDFPPPPPSLVNNPTEGTDRDPSSSPEFVKKPFPPSPESSNRSSAESDAPALPKKVPPPEVVYTNVPPAEKMKDVEQGKPIYEEATDVKGQAKPPPTQQQILPVSLRERAVPWKRKQEEEPLKSATTNILCSIYGLLLIGLSIVLPISAVITQAKLNQIYYVDAFQLYLYGFSLIFLLYLHCFLLRNKEQPTSASTECIAVSKVEELPKSYLDDEDDEDDDDDDDDDLPKKVPIHSRPTSAADPDIRLQVTQQPAPVRYATEGVSVYLRLGAIAFGLGNVIHEGFRLAQVFESDTFRLMCYSPLETLVSTVHIVFISFQTYFLFKSHAVIINMHKALVRFGMIHVAASNVCVWLLTTINVSDEEFRLYSFPKPKYLRNSSGINITCPLAESLVRTSCSYLFPCTVEYSLIAAAIAYKIYRNVGRDKENKESAEAQGLEVYKNNPTDCHKANKGLFLGLFILAMTVVAINVFFFVFDEKHATKMANRNTPTYVFLVTEIALLIFACLTVLFGFVGLRKLRFSTVEKNFEHILIYMSFMGLCMYNAFSIVSCLSDIFEYDMMKILSLTSVTLYIVQASLQIVFILDGLRRRASSSAQVHDKPGRELVTFLLIINLALWAVNTFELQKSERIPLYSGFYGPLQWGIISYCTIPMIIFFRFHSTVCLAHIWRNAYTLKRKKA